MPVPPRTGLDQSASINRRCCSACAHPMRTASPSPASLVGSPRPPAASAPPPSSLLARAPDVSLGPRSGRGGGGGGTCQRGSCLLQVLSLHISDHALLLQRFLHGRPHSASPTTRSERWADGLQPESGRQAGAGAKGEGARRARSHPRAPPSVSASSPAPPSASPAAPAWKRSRSLGAAGNAPEAFRAGWGGAPPSPAASSPAPTAPAPSYRRAR